jgi:hypothetical protein
MPDPGISVGETPRTATNLEIHGPGSYQAIVRRLNRIAQRYAPTGDNPDVWMARTLIEFSRSGGLPDALASPATQRARVDANAVPQVSRLELTTEVMRSPTQVVDYALTLRAIEQGRLPLSALREVVPTALSGGLERAPTDPAVIQRLLAIAEGRLPPNAVSFGEAVLPRGQGAPTAGGSQGSRGAPGYARGEPLVLTNEQGRAILETMRRQAVLAEIARSDPRLINFSDPRSARASLAVVVGEILFGGNW